MEARSNRQCPWRRAGTLAALAAMLLLLADGAQAKAKSKKVSDYFLVCRRNDPDFKDCIKRSIVDAKPRLVKGIPEVRLPPIDPLSIEGLELREGQGNFLFLLRMRNLTITGLKDFALRDVQADLQSGAWRFDLLTPHLYFEADYEMQGRMLALPIQGNGRCTMDFYNASTVSDVQMKNLTRNGKLYTQVGSVKWTIKVEFAKSHFSNLFNGDKTLGDTTNKFLNENWKDAFETYKHLPEEAFGQFFTEMENRFFDQFPVDELYPE